MKEWREVKKHTEDRDAERFIFPRETEALDKHHEALDEHHESTLQPQSRAAEQLGM